MGYIRFNITRVTDKNGVATYSKINRIESDMPTLDTIEPNIIWNAISHKGSVCRWLELDEGLLNRDLLAESSHFTLDRDMLNVDKLI